MAKRYDTLHARRVRKQRAHILTRLEEGRVVFLDVLEAKRTGFQVLRRADVWEILLHVPRLGRNGARQVCERAGVWPHTRIGELSSAQRQALLDHLPPRAK